MKKTVAFLLLALIMVFTVSCTSNKMEELPEGTLLDSADSSNGTYRIETYLCSDKGEMHIRCAVVEIATSESRNIYWNKYNEDVDIEWVDDTNVKIEGKTINVTDEEAYFDYRE